MAQHVKIKGNAEGEFLGVAGGNYRIVISTAETNGHYAVIEMHVPPGGGPPPHSHPNIQEMFYVLEGEVEFKTEEGKKLVDKGGFVNIPFGGAVHCFKNTSDQVVKLLCTVVPGGLDNLFKEIGQPVQEGQFPPMPEMTPERAAFTMEINKRYGQQVYPPDFLD